MILYHFSEHEQITPYSVEQPERADPKPRGLWLSVQGEHDWESWCRDENFPIGEYRHRVTLAADDGVLVLTTPDEVLTFTSGSDKLMTPHSPCGDFIAWDRVAAHWPGIIIAPYQWSLRLDRRTFWYYGWDCASGCIWNADAIESVDLVVNAETGNTP